MSLNREMLQVARLSSKMLGESASLVAQYLHGLALPDGGYANRNGESDLYYSSFAVSGLIALQETIPVEAISRYISRFQGNTQLDLVHNACLLRLWTLLPPASRPAIDVAGILEQIEQLRTPDGGYNAIPGSTHGTLYGCFLAWGAYQDAGATVPDPSGMVNAIQSLKTSDGGYTNSPDFPVGLTPSSSAAATLLRQLGVPPDPDLAGWLLSRFHAEGGFFATPDAPIPDLLSTATALHALSSLHVDLTLIREPCLDFIDTLWTARGGFYGTWDDDHLDCEYTYYGLLALGHLSI